MKKFIKTFLLFVLFLIIVGELVVRITHSVSDIPQRTIDNSGIQKYLTNQTGYWKGGNHKWKINDLGWPGDLPNSYENLITIIGDSYIENFMNPNECHQGALLKQKMTKYNFLEAGRSGVSFIEAMEISKDLDTLQPVQTLIYVNDNDFYESISEIKKMSDITQLNLNKNQIIYGVMKSPGLKKVLYNWKLLYYFYNRYPINNTTGNKSEEESLPDKQHENDQHKKYLIELTKLFKYITDNYKTSDKTLIFHPKTNDTFIKLAIEYGFNTIVLDSSHDKSWTFDYDSHWTCYGHEQVANQVSIGLNKYFNLRILQND
ncbi:hypothetical protein [Winogradskyella poriferorum]|uniref:SGNH/GDSL hydrolase family protein n=1 Tax=Winogradskyella poriferorum TaxID=307627 RepID=A0ABU7W6G1_9FLAO|tara:strand:- start:12619 stop:13569 length:951 start_codon:yes stop_codon:yes gene_type:complete